MAKKTINVERIGQHSGHPITSEPVPVAESLRKKNVPYYIHENGTIVQSTVDKDGVNNQVFMKSNQAPSFGMIVNGQDSTAVKYNPELDYATRKYKPGTPEFKEIAKKTTIYGVPLATYDEAVANLTEVKNQAQHLQPGGEIPTNTSISFLENLPYGRHNVNEHNKLVEIGKRFGNMISGSTKPIPLPNKHQSDVPPAKMPMHKQDTSNIKPAPMPMYPGQSNDQMPMHGYNNFVIPQEMYQEGGNLPSDDQQQLFVAIITDMAKTLGVEPSQELAEAVITAFENNDDSEGLLTLFTQTKNKFMNETGLFREGGKMYAFVEKFKCGGKSPKKKTSKKQEGGEVEGAAGYITTPVNDIRARREWRRNNDATRAEARARQNELTDNLMGMGGISRRQARNSAAAIMGNPQRFMGESNRSYDLGASPAASLNVEAPQMGTPGSLERNYDNFDFNTAFGRARRVGEDTFMLRGKEYTTELAPEPVVQTRPDLTAPSVNGGVYPDYYYNNLAAAGAQWREKWNAKRAARKEREAALRAKAAEMNNNYSPVSLTEAAMNVIPSRRS